MQETLEEELERLKHKFQMGYELRVVWTPDDNPSLSGEVKGDRIFIYERNEEKVVETLRHEFLDYAISQVREPYREIANRLIMLMNEEAYRKKERLVEALRRLV